jgi:hypothetical protein
MAVQVSDRKLSSSANADYPLLSRLASDNEKALRPVWVQQDVNGFLGVDVAWRRLRKTAARRIIQA